MKQKLKDLLKKKNKPTFDEAAAYFSVMTDEQKDAKKAGGSDMFNRGGFGGGGFGGGWFGGGGFGGGNNFGGGFGGNNWPSIPSY